MLLFQPFTLAQVIQLLTSLSRKTSCGLATLWKLPFEIVLGMWVALKKQLEDEEKYRKEQEKEAMGEEGSMNISGYMGQAKSMMSNAQNSVKIPNVSMPSGTPHF